MKSLLLTLLLSLGVMTFAQEVRATKTIQKQAIERSIEKPIQIHLKSSNAKSWNQEIAAQFERAGEELDEKAVMNLSNYLKEINELTYSNRTGVFNPEPDKNEIRIRIHFKWVNRKGLEREIDIDLSFP